MNAEIEKVPSLVCEECGSFRVTITDDGPECDECDIKYKPVDAHLSMEVEYLIYQLKRKGKDTEL